MFEKMTTLSLTVKIKHLILREKAVLAKDLFIFWMQKDKTIISNFYQNGKAVTEMATGCLRMVKMDIFAFNNLRFYFS